MSIEHRPVLDTDDLNAADRRILDELHDGRGTPKFIAERIDTDRSYVSQRLKRLQEHGHVDRLETGLYELVDDPRTPEEDAVRDDTPTRRVVDDYLRDHHTLSLDDVETLQDERDELAERVHDLQQDTDVDTTRALTLVDQAEAAANRGDGDTLRTALEDLREVLEDAG